MKKSILALSIAALSIGAAHATPQGGGYEAVSGAAAASAASVAGNTTIGTGGYQVSGASASNVTSAGVTQTNTPTGVQLSATTSSVGDTSAYSFGEGAGTSSALAAQGGIAKAGTKTTVGDSDHSFGFHQTSGYGGTWDATGADFGGRVGAKSTSAQGSIAGASNNGTGYSSQRSGAGANNTTTAYLKGDADAYHKTASVDIQAGTHSEGSTYSYGAGNVSGNGAGGAGGIAQQGGKAKANADGDLYVVQGNWHAYYGGAETDGADGDVAVSSKSKVKNFSIAGGTGNHYGDTAAGSVASNDVTVSNKLQATPGGMTQTHDATSDTAASAGGWDVGSGYSSFYAKGKGGAISTGEFDGNTTVVSTP